MAEEVALAIHRKSSVSGQIAAAVLQLEQMTIWTPRIPKAITSLCVATRIPSDEKAHDVYTSTLSKWKWSTHDTVACLNATINRKALRNGPQVKKTVFKSNKVEA